MSLKLSIAMGLLERLLKESEECIAELEQRLAAAEAKIPRWIPVSERLPKDGVYVLVNIRDNDGDEYQALLSCFCGEFDVIQPTHWMPLPDAPGADHG